MTLTTLQIAEILGVPITGCGSLRIVEYLLTDSRSLSVPDSTVFFAIPTATANGADYIPELYSKGVRMFVASELPMHYKEWEDATFFIVDDVVASLQKIAAYHPDFHGTIVGITGSRGKTTLKEWLFQLLEPLTNVVRSPRSYNSKIGVPLSLWQIQPDTDMAIIEAGISRQGEMASLAKCISPDITIITNVGETHAEGFPSMQEKAKEKARLAAASSVKTIIFPADQPLVANAVAEIAGDKRLIGWSVANPEASLFIHLNTPNATTTVANYVYRKEGGEVLKGTIYVPSNLDYDLENSFNALSLMLEVGISPEIIAERFANLHKIGTRLNVSEGVNSCSLIFDSYTSDFSSLPPALDFMRRRAMPGRKRTMILSELHHESSSSEEIYAKLVPLLSQYGITRFIGVGPRLSRHAELFPENSQFFESTKDLLKNMSTSDFSDEIILLKGSPESDFSKILQMLEARTHETVLEVNLDSVVKNYNYFRSNVPFGTRMIAMVKASGYGAGSYEIARTLQDCGAAYLAVAVLDEGIDLRRQGITMPIMVMNPKVVNYKAMFAWSLEPEVYSMDMLNDMIREAAKADVHDYPVHIKLDTGMHRMGFIEEELPALMDVISSQNRVRVCSVFSHLATADCPDMDDYTFLQLSRFKKYSDYIISRSQTPVLRHILNSAGILRFPEHHYDMVRLGIGLYGVNTLPPEMERPLATVSTLRTVIIAIREYKAGETIGYGRRGVLERDSRVATIPIGYADGMNRHFGRGAIKVKVNGVDAPTVGNICMDACMIDVTGIDCKEGDPVEIFGPHADVHRLAELLDTIPYEILTSVSPRVKRVYYRE
ncbi:MAG: bifunctional UDP-N-acetylmuramoyl-tripeptide:D-alanyl-D-alanine ligase/alanine racemase [Prevotella sp.]|nr:bifunctional UDP-N-acetylmuramoyl-tripeptide:D-alanyl-D-alanine ligase/alanine racemase [Prevotella sp.]